MSIVAPAKMQAGIVAISPMPMPMSMAMSMAPAMTMTSSVPPAAAPAPGLSLIGGQQYNHCRRRIGSKSSDVLEGIPFIQLHMIVASGGVILAGRRLRFTHCFTHDT